MAAKKKSIMHIEDVMSSKIVALSRHAFVLEAAKKLSTLNVGAMVVIENGKLVGILSQGDIVNKVIARGLNPSKVRVSAVMTKRVFTAKKMDLLTKALRLMHKNHIRYLPVVEKNNRVVGIVSMRHLFVNYDQLIKKLVAERTKSLNAISRRFERYSNIDPLTELYNYRFFNNYLDTEIARSSRKGHDFSLVFVDIDNFKAYNDTFGHAKGNQLLKDLAQLLKPADSARKTGFATRKSDVAVRLGGDEFVLILPETNKQGALICAERLRAVFAKSMSKILKLKKNQKISISMGISSFPMDADNKKDIIEKADQALYQAKRLGRNRVCLYEESRFENIAS